MARDRATQIEILEAIVDRLRTKIPEFTEGTCFVSLLPIPVPAPAGDLGAIVSPGGGSFDTEMEVLGPHDPADTTVVEDATFNITLYTRIQTDQVGRSDDIVQSRGLGLLEMKRRVLRALLVDWEPEKGSNQLLRDMLHPVSAGDPDYDETARWGSMSLTFGTLFDWDLTL
jgi:hypothetical protein